MEIYVRQIRSITILCEPSKIMRVVFNKYKSLIDASEEYYALDDAVEKVIDNIKYLEITQDFKRVNYIREDMITKVGIVEKELKCF